MKVWTKIIVLAAAAGCGGDDTGAGAASASSSDGASVATTTSAPTSTSGGPATTVTGQTSASSGTGVVVDPVLVEDWEDGDAGWTLEGSVAIEDDPTRVRGGARSLRVDFRDPACGPGSCNADGNNCFENLPQVVSETPFDLTRFYVSWWVYYPEDFVFYDGPCMPTRGSQGHFVRFTNFHTPHDPNDSFYQAAMPDFGQYRASETELGIRAEWQWSENDTGVETIGRNMRGTTLATADLVGKWNHYELFVDLGTVGGSDGAIVWSVNDDVLFAIHDDALQVGVPFEEWDTWGAAEDEARAHPGMMRTSPEGFTRLGLVSNPNSSFGGRPGDVYWIDDVVIADVCPAGRPLCAPFAAP